MRQDYGQALAPSSALFDAVRLEASAAPDAGLRTGLDAALSRRDTVTAALAKGDPAVIQSLHDVELALRQALGYETPAPPLAVTT